MTQATSTTLQSLESAAFAAWPSALSDDINGWRLRLDRGYTKRANSANATAQSQKLSDADIDSIEAQFQQRGLTPTFRLTSFAPILEADALLAQRGYLHFDLSLVMTRPLADTDTDTDGSAGPALAGSSERWLEAFRDVSGKSGADQAVHLDILRRIAHPCAWAVQARAGSPLSCGLGVLVDRNLGLFDIATRESHQRQGLGRQVCREMLSWGRERGADTAFLQVLAANHAAVRLYEGLGFQVAYKYWYRVQAPLL